MKTHIGFPTLALSLVLLGCGDSKDSSGTTPPAPSAAEGTYLGSMAKAQKSAVKAVDLVSLNSAIQAFQVQEGRNPKDLDELIEKKIMSKLPPPPAGMKFEYDAKEGSVKIVPQ